MADFTLLPWQEKVERAYSKGATHIYIKAGRKSGKTEYIRYRLVESTKKEPVVGDQINPYIAPERIQAKNIFWRRVKNSIPKEQLEGRPKESELAVDFKSGLRLQLFGSDNEDACRGLSFGDGILDEADFMRPGFFEEVAEPNFSVTKAPIILSSTPKNGWFTKKWKEAKDGRMGRGHVAFHFTIYDNPYIGRDYIEKLRRSTPKEIWEQEYLANENAYTGLMYHEFENSHIVQHRTPPADGKFVRALDWGLDHPSHCLWAYLWRNDETGRWNAYYYNELSIRGKCVDEVVKPVLASDTRPFIFSVIDIAAKRREMATGMSIMSEFKRCGFACRQSLPDDAYNINAGKMMLKNGDIQISERCPILIKQLRSVEWGQQKGDDATDAFKYLNGMIYNRDFTNIESFQQGTELYAEERIDPMGLLAAQSHYQDTMSWGY